MLTMPLRKGIAKRCASLLERERTASVIWSMQLKEDQGTAATVFRLSNERDRLSIGSHRPASLLLASVTTLDDFEEGHVLLSNLAGQLDLATTVPNEPVRSTIDTGIEHLISVWPTWVEVSVANQVNVLGSTARIPRKHKIILSGRCRIDCISR